MFADDSEVNIEKAPHLISQILFMCIRYLDNQRDLLTARFLLQEYVKKVMNVISQNNQFPLIANCLANTHSLLNFLKQFSKVGLNEENDIKFNYANSPELLEQCLQNLDLSLFWEDLEQLGQWILEKSVKHIFGGIFEFSVPAFFYRSGESKIIDLKMKIFRYIEIFNFCKVDDQVRDHILKQVFSFINTLVVQHFMTNAGEFCHKFQGNNLR